jgi:glycosyltransferase involved in cell wall biosynthesis
VTAPRLSVVVPALREEQRIATTVTELRAALQHSVGADALEIVVVDDGSDDATAAVAEAAGADRVIRHPTNRGKGAAVRSGVLASGGSSIVFTDADLSYPAAQIARLLEDVEGGWDVIVGNRRHRQSRTLDPAGASTGIGGNRGRLRAVSGRLFNSVTRLALKGRYGDTQCGLKAFRRDAALRIFSTGRLDGFAFDVEVLLLGERLGLSIKEVPVDVRATAGTTVHLAVDASRMVRDVIRLRRCARAGVYDTPREVTTLR